MPVKKKSKITNFLLVLAFLAGVSLILYPTVSNYWNSKHNTQIIANYTEKVVALPDENIDAMYNAAIDYNKRLAANSIGYEPDTDILKEYNSTLNIYDGVMGYVEIEALGVSLPIYHGTADSVLQTAVGHLDWTSLPVGGEGSHCVISGHRGLPGAKLFTNLDKLREGDVFTLHILNNVLTYEVDQILIVLPEETEPLQIVNGKDYCTLLTCTPYSINTHRLLVRGHRIENANANEALVVSEAIQVDELLVTAMILVPLLSVLLILVFAKGGKKGKHSK